jgi:hypothetical protein
MIKCYGLDTRTSLGTERKGMDWSRVVRILDNRLYSTAQNRIV